MHPIYLDNNATTAIHPDVAAAMHECYLSGIGNPSSQHFVGRRARRMLADARDAVAEMLGARVGRKDADHLIFTSGGTESNNLAIRGLVDPAHSPRKVLFSTIEHPSVMGAVEHLRDRGFTIVPIPVDSQGVIRTEELRSQLDEATQLVTVMLGNNETGVIQPIPEVVELCRAHGIPVHTDAVQAVGKIPVHFQSLGVCALSFSAHKFHGPVGIGGLLVRHGHEKKLRPILFGGHQQKGARPGTEPVGLVVGLRKALELWQQEQDHRTQRMEFLRDRLTTQLRTGYPSIVINGEGAPRLPHTLSVAFPGLDRQALVMALDLVNVAISTGSACASGSSEPSSVLLAMGLSQEVVGSSIRLSISCLTSESDVDEAAQRIIKAVKDLQSLNSARDGCLPPRVAGKKSI